MLSTYIEHAIYLILHVRRKYTLLYMVLSKSAGLYSTRRCNAHLRKSNRPCNRTVAHGEKCWFHSQIDDGLRVKKSKIPNAGRGLFATKAIPSHHLIDKFKGPTLSENQVEKLPESRQQLCVPKNNGKFIDSSKTNSCYARYANEARHKRDENSSITETKRGGSSNPELESDKPIKKGQEIKTYYGRLVDRNYEVRVPESQRRGRGRGGRRHR